MAPEPEARHAVVAVVRRVPVLYGSRRARRVRQNGQRLVPVSSEQLQTSHPSTGMLLLNKSAPGCGSRYSRDSTREHMTPTVPYRPK